MQTKRCTKCGETKPLEAFYVASHAPDGRYPSCSACKLAASRARYWKSHTPDPRRALRTLVPPAEIDPGFGHWLAGFIDGEGCFLVHNKPNGPSHHCLFRIGLHADDEPILEEIRDRLGSGSVWGHTPPSCPTSPRAMWTVNRKQECIHLVEFLDRYPLRAKKARDYAIWREAVTEWTTKYPGGKDQDWAKMAALKAELAAGRPLRGRFGPR
jgi:hypothetical protein